MVNINLRQSPKQKWNLIVSWEQKKGKIIQPARAEQSSELVTISARWLTAWSLRQKPVAASAVSSAERKDTHAPWQALFVSVLEAYILFETYP